MASKNSVAPPAPIAATPRLAGGAGPHAAPQSAEMGLRRVMLANLLWEDNAYTSGADIAKQIAALVPQIDPLAVAQIAIEARTQQRLRHAPLYLAVQMARHPTHRGKLGALLPQIIRRPDDATEFLALYWQDGKVPLAKQVKTGLAAAFTRWDAYQLAKWRQADKAIKLRDALRLSHPKPRTADHATWWGQLNSDTLPAPDTWEVALSAGKDKTATFTHLIAEGKLGAQAFVRNLRGMIDAGVDDAVIRQGFATIKPDALLPIEFIKAAKAAPRFEAELERFMFECLARMPKLAGTTLLVVDVSGSMEKPVSATSHYADRLDAAAALAALAREVCEQVRVYATAGSDYSRTHQSALVPARRGFALVEAIKRQAKSLGGGGIFTRQVLEWLRTQERGAVDRIMVFSDSQDCDHPDRRIPDPWATHNYIIDIASHQHGVNYVGKWDAEIHGWSEHFIPYVAAYEALRAPVAP